MLRVNPDDLFLVGQVTLPHGVHGEMKVRPETDDPARFALFERIYIGADAPRAARSEREVEGVRFQTMKNGTTAVLLGLAGVDTREDAADLRGQSVFAHVGDLPPLEDGEVFVHDLIGMSVVVVDEKEQPTGETVGEVRDVLETGASLMFSVAREGRPDLLVPDVPPIVRAVDTDAREIRILPPDGLLDL